MTSPSVDEIPGISLYQVMVQERLIHLMKGQDVVPMAQGEGLSSDIEDALHEFHSFSPPCQTPEPEVPSIPLNFVYEDVTQGKV